MKSRLIILLLIAASYGMSGCKKLSDDSSNIYKYVLPPGATVSDAAPLCGSIKGVMLTGKTYTLGCDVYINKGDTLIIQPGVTVNSTNGAGIIVRGSFISLGTQSQPNYLTVQGVSKNTTPGIPLAKDSAHIGLWKGIIGDTSCTNMIIKWTHIDFAGAAYGNVAGPAVEQKASTSFCILFQNPNGNFILEDSWLWGGTDDCIRVSSGKIHVFRNTFEKCGGTGGDIVNVKGGTVGTMAYNFFIGTAYNGQKASNKGQPTGAMQTNIVMYNSTFVNGGLQVIPGQRGSTINYEEGAAGSFYNNVAVNCRVGYRVVINPVADTLHLTYGNNYQYADSLSIANQFFTFGPVCTRPQTTDIPAPYSYLPANYTYGASYDGTPVVQALNPQFVNYPLPSPYSPWSVSAIGSYNFRLKPNSPLIGKGNTSVTPLVVVPVDMVYGASEVTPPGADLGCYQTNGRGNQH
ncbi:MAG: hypothetical protein J0I09_13720 [Sphingobacteriia bacterium]|nr:hypothetical protein [Sphingobacteriia bacterium]